MSKPSCAVLEGAHVYANIISLSKCIATSLPQNVLIGTNLKTQSIAGNSGGQFDLMVVGYGHKNKILQTLFACVWV